MAIPAMNATPETRFFWEHSNNETVWKAREEERPGLRRIEERVAER